MIPASPYASTVIIALALLVSGCASQTSEEQARAVGPVSSANSDNHLAPDQNNAEAVGVVPAVRSAPRKPDEFDAKVSFEGSVGTILLAQRKQTLHAGTWDYALTADGDPVYEPVPSMAACVIPSGALMKPEPPGLDIRSDAQGQCLVDMSNANFHDDRSVYDVAIPNLVGHGFDPAQWWVYMTACDSVDVSLRVDASPSTAHFRIPMEEWAGYREISDRASDLNNRKPSPKSRNALLFTACKSGNAKACWDCSTIEDCGVWASSQGIDAATRSCQLNYAHACEDIAKQRQQWLDRLQQVTAGQLHRQAERQREVAQTGTSQGEAPRRTFPTTYGTVTDAQRGQILNAEFPYVGTTRWTINAFTSSDQSTPVEIMCALYAGSVGANDPVSKDIGTSCSVDFSVSVPLQGFKLWFRRHQGNSGFYYTITSALY